MNRPSIVLLFAISACEGGSDLVEVRRTLAVGGHACVIDDDDALRCWGAPIWEVPLWWEGPGDGRFAVPIVDVPGGVADVAVGEGWICAVSRNGTLPCWGSGDYGLPFVDQRAPGDPRVADVGEPFIDVAIGWAHICAATLGGAVWCWGENDDGQLGQGHLDEIDAEPSRGVDEILLPSAVVEVSAGGRTSCARTDDGDVYCWGDGVSTPTRVELEAPASAIAVGRNHACAIDLRGGLACWGAAQIAAPGGGYDAGTVVPPTPLAFAGAVTQVSAGHVHNCVVLDDGTAHCWGANEVGQLGLGHTDAIGDDEPPGDGPGIDAGGPIAAIDVGDDETTCARLLDGRVRCWGHTERWDDTSDEDCQVEVPNPNAGNICEPATIEEFSCAAGDRCCLGDDEPASAALPVPL